MSGAGFAPPVILSVRGLRDELRELVHPRAR
jgi:hypothetical protein